jgi:hypothetical protein
METPWRIEMAKYPGSLKARAAKVGKSTEDYADEVKEQDSVVGKMARLHFAHANPGMSGKAKLDEPGDNRKKRNPLYQVG